MHAGMQPTQSMQAQRLTPLPLLLLLPCSCLQAC